MATVKKSKSKVIVPICIVLVIAIVAGSIFAFAGSKKVKEVQLHTITTDDIHESVSLTGEVSAGTIKEYKVGTVATVKEVFVKVGDTVKKNDVLATFDVNGLNEQISSIETSYNTALKQYNASSKTQQEAAKNAAKLKKEIAALEKKIAKLEKAPNTTKKKTTIATAKPSQTTTTKPTTKLTTTTKTTTTTTTTAPSTETTASTTPTTPTLPSGANIDELIKSLTELNKTLTDITTDLHNLSETTAIIADIISKAAADGNFDSNAMSQKIGEAIGKAMRDGIIESTNMMIESGLAVKMIEAAVSSIDYDALGNSIMNSKNVTLTAAQIQLACKEVQYTVFNAQSNETVLTAQKSAVNAYKKALDVLTAQKQELDQGWVAAFDGTITAVSIEPNTQTSVVSSGITLENLDTMVATISLSEYDVHKVKVGMPATITTAYGKYQGEVATIAPTATGGSSTSILDNVGSMAGISGLSSLTSSGAGVQCTVTINDTDENIIAGFNADVEIQTGQYLGTVVVPIESIKLEKAGSFVYLYNPDEKTVTKTQIQTGAVSDSYYEVVSGLSAGDQIIAAPESTYEEDTFKVKVSTK